MKNLYEVGKVYVWVNQRAPYEWLNGVETVVVSDLILEKLHNNIHYGHKTTTIGQLSGKPILAEAGDLRRKNTPPGEQSIISQFQKTKVEEVIKKDVHEEINFCF